MKLLLSAILPGVKQIRFYSNYLRKLTKSTITDFGNVTAKKLPEQIRDKILFSSFLEEQIPRLGYRKNVIAKSIIAKHEKKEKYKNAVARPLPASLKFLDVDTNLEPEAPKKECTQSQEIKRKQEYVQPTKVPNNWMKDYEHFEESGEEPNPQGTPDPTILPSKVPCSGCGAPLQCAHPSLTGYLPSEIFKGRTDDELKTIICQRCHFLKVYNIALDVEVQPEDYVNILSSIKDKFALAVLIVDLLDFPCSLWPGIQEILGDKRPIFIVGNKVDLLPKDHRNYLDHIKKCLLETVVGAGLNKMNIKHIHLISAKTGYGVEELITQLHNIWKYNGDVYLVGCTNVGKSTLFNALLRSDYCKVKATNLIQKATTCPWPGTTLNMLKFPILRPSDFRVFMRYKRLSSEQVQRRAEEKLRRDQLRKTRQTVHATLIGNIGRSFVDDKEPLDLFSMPRGTNPILTLNEKDKDFIYSKWCYDTPGVMHPDQIHHLLTTEELLKVMPTEMIAPRVYKVNSGLTLFLGGLGRLDFISEEVDFTRLSIYSSHEIPILITRTEDADEIYEKLLGTEFLGIPIGDENRLSQWPKLKSSDLIEITGESFDAATCDILLSSIGWAGIKLPVGKKAAFKAWTPQGRGIVVRKPSLVPFGEDLRGQKIRGCPAYRVGKPFIVQ